MTQENVEMCERVRVLAVSLAQVRGWDTPSDRAPPLLQEVVRMRRFFARRPSPAMAVGFVALLAALSGTAVALPGVNLIDSGDIKNGQVKAKDIGKNAVTGKKVANGALTGADVKDESLTASDFSGSVQGPAGPQGPQGNTGTQGPQGDTGAPGIPGSAIVARVRSTS